MNLPGSIASSLGGKGIADFLVSTLTGDASKPGGGGSASASASPSRYGNGAGAARASPRRNADSHQQRQQHYQQQYQQKPRPQQQQQQQAETSLFSLVAKSAEAMGATASSGADKRPEHELTGEVFDEGPEQNLGRLNFVVSYDWHDRHLTIKICHAQKLPAMDFPMGTSDPYCKISILPDKGNKVKTKIKMRKLNPKWNEVFVFEDFPGERLLDRTLFIQVYDYDRFSRYDSIGDVHFPLVFLYDSDKKKRSYNVWRQLQPNKKTRGYVGDVMVSLGYNPQSSQLTLIAIRARDLKAMDLGRTSDPYCVVKLIHNKTNKECDKKKGTVIYKNLNPQWNESFNFTVSPDKIHEYQLELVVKDKDFIGSDTIGKIRLGTRSSTEESKHWTEMMNRPRQQVSKWHTLKH